mgnify:CR=1 FL=1|jgi:AraC-like DNA-binding protein
MDKSTQIDRKNKQGEINPSPIPAELRPRILDSGLLIRSYYEGVPSRGRETPEPVPRVFSYMVLTQMIGGRGLYWNAQSGSREIRPGQWICVTSHYESSYFGYQDSFIEDSISFLGGTATALATNGIIKNGLFDFGKERRLLPIIHKLRESTAAAFLEANAMLVSLLFEFHHAARENNPSPALTDFNRLLQEIKRNMGRWWTVGEMAEFCNISENYLRRIFHEHTGVSPKSYLDNLRMNRAAELLTGTRRSIPDIAKQLGYMDPYHFIRRFSQLMAIPPARYRKNFRDRYL